MIRLSRCVFVAALVLVTAVGNRVAVGEDWPRFRGANGTGVSTSHGLPVEFGPTKNVVWKVDASHGSSSPIISHGLLFFSSFDGEQRTLHCLDASTGKVRWTQSVKKVRTETATPPNGPATPTPATDGESVFVMYPEVGVLCYSIAGQERWRVDLPAFHSMHGIASSLVTIDNLVIVVADQLAGLIHRGGFQCRLGKGRLEARTSGRTGRRLLDTVRLSAEERSATTFDRVGPAGSRRLRPNDRQARLWWISGITNACISVPVIWRDRAFVCEELGEPVPFSMLAALDKNKDGKNFSGRSQGERAHACSCSSGSIRAGEITPAWWDRRNGTRRGAAW